MGIPAGSPSVSAHAAVSVPAGSLASYALRLIAIVPLRAHVTISSVNCGETTVTRAP